MTQHCASMRTDFSFYTLASLTVTSILKDRSVKDRPNPTGVHEDYHQTCYYTKMQDYAGTTILNKTENLKI